MTSTKPQKKTIGGSFGGLVAAQTLGNNFNVIIVDRKSFFEYTPSFHYALQDENYIDKITADLENYAKKKKFRFIFGSAIELNSTNATIKKSDGQNETISFDYCIVATGSNYASQIKSFEEAKTLQERKEQIKNLIQKLNSCRNILIVGGGPVGVEFAGVCKDQFKHVDIHLWQRSDELLQHFPKRARKLADKSLTKLGVKIEYNKSISTLPEDKFDYIFDCRGNIYSPDFMKNEEFQQYIDQKGRILVDEYLRLENHQNIFCIGDACLSPNDEPKMSYNASIQGQYTAQNIIKIEKKDKKLKKLSDSPNVFNVTTGKKNAIFCLGEKIAFESILVHYLKMMLEWISSSTYKGSCFGSCLGYLQRQTLICMTSIFSCIHGKKSQKTKELTQASKQQ